MTRTLSILTTLIALATLVLSACKLNLEQCIYDEECGQGLQCRALASDPDGPHRCLAPLTVNTSPADVGPDAESPRDVASTPEPDATDDEDDTTELTDTSTLPDPDPDSDPDPDPDPDQCVVDPFVVTCSYVHDTSVGSQPFGGSVMGCYREEDFRGGEETYNATLCANRPDHEYTMIVSECRERAILVDIILITDCPHSRIWFKSFSCDDENTHCEDEPGQKRIVHRLEPRSWASQSYSLTFIVGRDELSDPREAVQYDYELLVVVR